ncbi:MAG: T9SS type A sorting domain-containing protein [Lewinellaceae bacterium]|nr:T9SS type A sorting domain-containing protein [Lewinellaceae bacterium]
MKTPTTFRLLTLALALGATLTPTMAQTFEVTAPASVAGVYNHTSATFSPQAIGFSGQLAEVEDADGSSTACAPIASDVSGAVALIDRGDCTFQAKAFAAQDAGAIGVVICNNDTSNPDVVIPFGGSFSCPLAIPTVMLSYNACQELRLETNVLVTYTPPAPPPLGYTLGTAIEITDGAYTVDAIPANNGGTFAGATGELWYAYTPVADGVLNINSCDSPADNRLILAVSPAGCTGDMQIVDFALNSANSCTAGPGAGLGADLDVLVFSGLTYYLIWDNAEGSEGFDFTISLNPLPQISLTFSVNMEMESVSAGGVTMVYAAPGATDVNEVLAVPMADEDGDGVWSATISLATLDTIGYAFVNGDIDPANIESVPDECGLPSGFGFNIRPLINLEIEDVTLDPVCFDRCTNCPAVSVTFNVDMAKVAEWGAVSPEGVHLAGSFQGWDPAATPMADNGDGTWSYTTLLAPGTEVQYQFINGNAIGQEEKNVTADCGIENGAGSFNRILVLGDEAVSTPFYCFDFCVTCGLVATDEQALQAGVKVFPNPAKGLLNVDIELQEEAKYLHIRLVNTLGQVVYSRDFGRLKQENIEIDVANLPSGAYLIQVSDGKARYTQSVIVQ